MKGCLVVLAVLLLPVAAIGGFLWMTWDPTDTTPFTEEVSAVPVSSTFEDNPEHRDGDGSRITYDYEIDGVAYRSDAWLPDQTWSEGDGLRVCVDPSDPAEHLVVSDRSASCGDRFLGWDDPHRATPLPNR
jgi:hypothetical protein